MANAAAFRTEYRMKTAQIPVEKTDGFSASPVDPHKRMLGQFFTQKKCWLRHQIKEFIIGSKCSIVYDPFAGSGCLIDAVKNNISQITESVGMDIDNSLGWRVNDSLINIPHIDNSIIITNPPYISNYSARRKKISTDLERYFSSTEYDDVYLLALDKMIEAQDFVVALVPETFVNSTYRHKDRLYSITILEENPFEDTDSPVVVLCFDSISKGYDRIKIYKDDNYICSLKEAESCRLVPNSSIEMKFNSIKGWLAVRCVDNTSPNDRLRFSLKKDMKYDWDNGLKNSSRLLTLIDVKVPEQKKPLFILECNKILEDIRERSHDIILSPFKGNTKNGKRRRRLDFLTCRAIVEKAYEKVVLEIEKKQTKQ